MADSFDVIVIGGGPGGYVAAIRAAQLGKKTAVVERDKAGGRCLNYACIPAKTILRTAEIYTEARESAELGVVAKDVSLDWDAVGKRRAAVSESLSGGVKMLWDKNKVTVIEGEGSLTAEGNVKVGDEVYEAGAVILATGSVALPIPGVEFGEPRRRHLGRLVAARAAEEDRRRRRRRLGLRDRLRLRALRHRGAADRDARRRSCRPRTRTWSGSSSAPSRSRTSRSPPATRSRTSRPARARSSSPTAASRPRSTTSASPAAARADIEALGLSEAGVELEENGKVKVDELQRTTNPKVYAIGDLVNAKALAHKASEEGVVAVEHAAGAETHPVDQNLVAGATFCHPQVASVGLTEAAAKEAGNDVKVGKLKLGGVGGATVYDDKEGLVKIVVDSKYGEILGAHIVGNRACDMIAELVATMALEGGYQELARIVHPHPTISEAILEAARAVDGWATHA